MKRMLRSLRQSLHPAAAAVALTCWTGCSSRPTEGAPADPTVPASPAAARILMDDLDRELATADVDPEAAAFARERLRGRLLAADIPAAEVDDWSGNDRL